MRFPLRRTLFLVVIALLVVPLQMSLIPVLEMYKAVGITNSFLGVWLAHTSFGLPLAIFLLYNFISQLPSDLFETASIDGATHFQMFRRVVLPLSIPALAAFAIFQFLWVWNDLLVALVFLSAETEQAVMTLELSKLVGGRGQQWHLLTAGAFVTMIAARARVPGAAAVLRAGDPVRVRQGLTVAGDPAAPILRAFEGDSVPEEVLAAIRDGEAAGVALYRGLNVRSPSQLRAIGGALRAAAADGGRPVPIVAIDQEGGQLMGIGAPATQFAGPLAMGAVGDPDLARRVGAAIGTELLGHGRQRRLGARPGPRHDALEPGRRDPVVRR